METYIHELTDARLYVGSAQTAVGEATELARPLAGCVACKLHTLVVEPLPNGDVLLQSRHPDGKLGLLVVSCEDARLSMGIANVLCDKGVHLPRWVRYAIDAPSRPTVIYCRKKSIR
jgi:hypothetical protein